MKQPKTFTPFTEFVKSLAKRPARKLLQSFTERVTNDSEAEVMRNYLEKYYKNTTAVHSFIDTDGQIWDCVPVGRQPNINRAKRIQVLTVPEYPGDASLVVTNNLVQDNAEKEPLGNKWQCPEGCIPVKRLTLEMLSKFKTLSSFHQKRGTTHSLFSGQTPSPASAEFDEGHRYVYVRQLTSNRGGGSILSLWRPAVDPNSGQILSLSQIWIFGGSGAQFQAVEVGWQVCPDQWGTYNAVLFVYWTADNYGSTGNYNLQGGAFVQTNSHWLLGGAINPVSVVGGQQFDMVVEWFFVNNAWWLYLNKQAVGYYPKGLFGASTLSTQADGMMAGGEVSGDGSWSAMGSGIFAQQRYGQSAYIRNAHLMANDGTIYNMNMNPAITSPNCYSYVPGDNPTWGSSFFYGGPGGGNC